MRVGVFLDWMGHFRVVPINQRQRMLDTLKDFDGGDMWANEVVAEGNDKETGLLVLHQDHWEMFLTNLTQRGRFEIIEL